MNNIELPEIARLGKTQVHNLVFDPFSFEKKESRKVKRNILPLNIQQKVEESQ